MFFFLGGYSIDRNLRVSGRYATPGTEPTPEMQNRARQVIELSIRNNDFKFELERDRRFQTKNQKKPKKNQTKKKQTNKKEIKQVVN